MIFTLSDTFNLFHFTEKLYLQKDILHRADKNHNKCTPSKAEWYYSILYCGTEHCIVVGTTHSTQKIMMSILQ